MTWPRAVATAVGGNRRLYGGLVVHLGVVVFAVAFTMSSAFATDTEAALARGESTSFAGYRLTYLGSETRSSAQKSSQVARIEIEQGGRSLGVYEPAVTRFPNTTQAIGTPSVRAGLLEDVYLTLVPTMPGDVEQIVLGIRVNPLVVWLWVGAGVMLAGAALAAWPNHRRMRVRAARR